MDKWCNSEQRVSIGEVLWKSFWLGIKVKTPVSMLVSVMAVPAALMPLLLSKQLQKLTDLLVRLAAGASAGVSADGSAGALAGTSANLLVSETAGVSAGTLAGAEGLAAVGGALVMLAFLFLCQQCIQFVTDYYAIADKHRTRLFIKEFVLRQACYVHYSYIENRDDFMKKIEFADSLTVEEMSRNIQAIFRILQQLVTVLSIGLALWMVHPVLVLILVMTSIPAAFLSCKQSDETFRFRAKWSEDGSLAIHYYQICSRYDYGMQEVRHYELFDYLKARWRAVADRYIFKKKQLTAKHLRANMLADFLQSAVYLVILMLTAWQIYQNPLLGVGTFTLVYTLSDRLQKSVSSILGEIMQFSTSLNYLREFFSLEKLEHERLGTEPLPEISGERGKVRFEHVSFTYPNSDREVLHDISVDIESGEKIAIVGDNGSGKSTFISLLAGLFSPCGGQVWVDGLPMEQYRQEIRENISVTFQDFAHYEATLRENVTVSDGERHRTDEEIMELARKVHVEDVIESQPDGLDSLIGNLSQKRNDLSGGQWQKIALLRAVYRNHTNIMILDEPTAALDPLAETELYQNFSQITGDRTTLLISHRLGITKLVDRILVFRDGRIIEDGTHQELMERKGHYYEMYQAQAAWYQ